MHEGAIVHSLLELAKDIQKKENLKEITKVKIVVGKFHQIIEEVMLTNFEFMKTEYEGFENAILTMSEKDVRVKCKNCQHEFTIDEPIFMCPECDSFDTELISGKELYIQTLEGTQ
ncbi:MAG: hydrogenase maturation nickel metallochaperone HypA [Candidatus Cloacimonetes bacterium]|nr:hydrogenase maturation nickel metallochaperone HypA [Candidatus Cloacimonadota bacterium]MCF7814526.1 hydrogenase maturation nickel metallochaperone HypA [Candidatus Cloacimonadota bacterium]MCF7867682.1 hydrogenase maturation nickel metallochaperone HypA [Candidatus Cloacimonadota bacterium]MCF7883520.1 hydrogenase maturation nickel metallochaperone HypA [Candidatus Cloacimonadota bacterium]